MASARPARRSVLGRLNPSAKFGAVLIAVLSLTFTTRWQVLLALAIAAFLATWLLGRVPLRRLLGAMLLVAVPASTLLIQYIFFADLPAGTPVWFRLGPLVATWDGLLLGFAIWVRVLAVSAFSFMFVLTTDPTDFALSLMQQLRLPHTVGYGLLVAYRFLPLLRQEFTTIQAAQQVRGLGLPQTWRQRLTRLFQLALPLLAAGIRKAGRTAVAMDARGFGQAEARTFYRKIGVSWSDALFAAAVAAAVVAAFAWL